MKASPQLNRWRPAVGIAPRITDAELITVSVMQALLGYHNESRWIRYARKSIIHLFPHLPKQPGYNKPAKPEHPTGALHRGAGHRHRPVAGAHPPRPLPPRAPRHAPPNRP